MMVINYCIAVCRLASRNRWTIGGFALGKNRTSGGLTAIRGLTFHEFYQLLCT